MKLVKFNKLIFLSLGSVIVLYMLTITALPNILSSNFMIKKYENYINQKFDCNTTIKDLNIKISPLFKTDITLDYLLLTENENKQKIAEINYLNYTSKNFSLFPKKISAKNIYANYPNIKSNLPKSNKKKKSFDFKIKDFPIINIEKIDIDIDKNITADISQIKSEVIKDNIECTFLGKIQTPYFKKPIIIGQNGKLLYSKNLYFDNLSVSFDTSGLLINGKSNDVNIYGKNLNVNEVEKYFLKFFKLTHNNRRNFIENFENFKGTLDVNLNFQNGKFNGICITKNLGADFSKFKIPVFLPRTIFYFKDKNIHANTQGTFGSEAVTTDFYLTGLATKNLHTQGTIHSKLTDKFTRKYFNYISIEKYADALVKYDVKNGIVNMDYQLTLPQGSSILSGFGIVQYKNTLRQFKAHTIKQGEDIYMNKYLLLLDNEEVLNGDALFKKINNHYSPDYMTLKTKGDISLNLIGNLFNTHIYDGAFNADLKYLFNNQTAQGFINLKNVKYSNFLDVNNLNFNVDGKFIKVTMNGNFVNEPIQISLLALNSFTKGFHIEDINIHLKKYLIVRQHVEDVKKEIHHLKPIQKTKNKAKYNVEVKRGKILVDSVEHSRFKLQNVALYGSLNNDIVEFVIPRSEYAKGLLSGFGIYDLATHSSNIKFFASDIDSNEVATNLFKLNNQIKGSAYANLHFKSWNRLSRIYAEATFAIENGFLPTLGTKEFVINKNKNSKLKKLLFFINKPIKFTLEKITNIDFSKPNIFYSDLRGSFVIDESHLHNIKVFSQSDYLSMYIEGDYDMDQEYASMQLWGRHNYEATKKIKIFKIPISWLYKLFFRTEKSKDIYEKQLDLVPPIKAKNEDSSLFRINIDGNLNTDNKTVVLKKLK